MSNICTLRILSVILWMIFSFENSYGQVEVSYLSTKNFSKFGYGGSLSFGIPVSEANSLRFDGGIYLYGDEDVIIAPVLLGYRKSLDGSGRGWYLEPGIGFTFGETTLRLNDGNGNFRIQKSQGPTLGIGGGFLLRGDLELDIGIRYRLVYIPTDPVIQFLNFKISYPLFRNRYD